jgi:hypothetical protein
MSKESSPAKGISPEKQSIMISHVNMVIQGAIRAVLLASTGTCKCTTCQAMRALGPHVNKILELGEQVTRVKAV